MYEFRHGHTYLALKTMSQVRRLIVLQIFLLVLILLVIVLSIYRPFGATAGVIVPLSIFGAVFSAVGVAHLFGRSEARRKNREAAEYKASREADVQKKIDAMQRENSGVPKVKK